MTQIQELDKVKVKFLKEFGKEPEVCIVVPGRVNLIGEHVDYSGFPVLPMALERSVMVAACRDTSHIPASLHLVNTDPTHPPFTCPISSLDKIDYRKQGWGSYFLCGIRGALESCSIAEPSGSILALVTGNVPPGAGLSSSSALVCAAFLTMARLNQVKISMEEAAEKCAECERYIGTAGGGMDQAIALLASAGCAKLIEFEPVLSAKDVSLPEDSVFVLAHSRVTKNKAASSEFNTRVVECRLAAQMLGKRKGLEWRSIHTLKQVVDMLKLPLSDAPSLVLSTLTQNSYTKSQICSELGESEDNLPLTPNTRHVQVFHLRQRALHVYQEAYRVYEWTNGGDNPSLLGKLMLESHLSLRDLYECSHPRVDTLVEACLSAGALGARITGAGWGGCVVALTTKSKVDTFISSVKSSFYSGESTEEDLDDLIFPTAPGHGAQIFPA